MKINQYLLGFAVMLMGGFSSCNTDVEGSYYNPQAENISFEVPSTSVLIPVDQTSTVVPIRLTRSKTAGEYTVHYTAQASQEGIFSDDANGTAVFANGQGFVTINVAANNLEKEVTYQYKLTLSDADAATADEQTNKQYTEIVVKVQREGDWIYIGDATFTDNFWFEGTGENVPLYYNEQNPNQYRLVRPFEYVVVSMYGEQYDSPQDCINDNLDGNQSNLTFTLLKAGDTVGGVTVTKDNLVYFEGCNTGYFHSNYSQDVLIYHPSAFTSLNTEDKWLFNCVTDYQEDGKPGRIQLAPYYYMDGVGGWNNTQSPDIVYIDFPGFTPRDYSMEMSYKGIFVNTNNETFAVAELVLGADATNVKAVVVSADDDAEAVADAIAAGELEGTEVEAGDIYVPIPEDLNGKLQLVVVILDETGNVKGVDSVFFEYYSGSDSPWRSLGVGYWVDDIVVPLFTEAGESFTYQVEIEENKETPGLYRVLNAYAPVAAGFETTGGNENIEINAEQSNFVYIMDQPIGLDFGYGAMSIETDAGYLIAQYGFDDVAAQLPEIFGKVENGEITFPMQEGESSSGAVVQYQIWLNMGSSSYFGGRNGEFKIILPTASSAVKKRAQSQANATDFALRLNGRFAGVKTSAKNVRKAYNNIVKSQVRSKELMK